MPVNQRQSRLVFEKLSRQLTKLCSKPAAQNVHKFRTYSRRVEALLIELVPNPGGNDKKVLKILADLRRKAGRERDVEIQMSALRNLKLPEAARHKAQLLAALGEERARRQKKLEAAFDTKSTRELRKRLKRAAADVKIANGQPLTAARRLLAELPSDHAPISEKVLHQYRMIGKRARYLAELAGRDPEARRVVEELKKMQDAIGDWHDWWKLTQRAEQMLGDVPRSPLVAALGNITRAKFRLAVDALVETRKTLSAGKPHPVSPVRKAKAASAVA